MLAAFVTLMMNVPQAVTLNVTLSPLTPTVPVPVPPVFVAEIAPVPLPPPTGSENASPLYVFVTEEACPSSVNAACSTASDNVVAVVSTHLLFTAPLLCNARTRKYTGVSAGNPVTV